MEVRVQKETPEYYYKGAFHIHSRYSDGSGSVKSIVKAALQVGLDFLVLTDHNTLKASRKGYDGWVKNRLLLLVGEEVSHSNQHLLALGAQKEIPPNLTPAESSSLIQDQGGLAFVAHPDGQYHFLFQKKDYRWKNWELETITGAEIWSYMFDWVEDVKPWNLPYYLLFPERCIQGPKSITLQRWDFLNRSRRNVGIGGIDAHARGIYPIQVFPYKMLLRQLVTYVVASENLPENSREAQQKLLNYLRLGRCYFAFEHLAPAAAFSFFMETPTTLLQMGDRHPFESNIRMRVQLPRRATIHILRDGNCFQSIIGRNWDQPVREPGVYRIEVRIEKKPWIFSNPIVLLET